MSKKIRWGILSTAKIARNAFIPAIQASRNGEVLALCSRDGDRARKTADDLGVERAYGSYEELLADPEIDAIYNPLPVAMHAEWTIACARAGKPCLCEKPFTLNAAEAQRVVEAFADDSLPVAESFMYRHHPIHEKALSLLKDGVIGDLRLVRTSFCTQIEGEGNIRYNKDLGGGTMLDLGCYCINGLRFFTGEEPEAIDVNGVIDPETGVDVTVAGALRFPSGVIGHFGTSMVTPFECSYELLGSEGRLRLDQGGFVTWPDTAFALDLWRGEQHEKIEVPAANHYARIAEDFADAILEGREPRYPADDAVKNMAVIDAVRAQIFRA